MKEIKRYLTIAQRWVNEDIDPIYHDIVKKSQTEFETKVDIESEKDLILAFSVISNLKIIKSEHRSEIQHLFKTNEQEVIYMILVDNIKEVWLKVKIDEFNNKQMIHAPLPLVIRKGFKYKPRDNGYNEIFNKISKSEFIYSYHKECLNYYFKFKELFFSLSVSLAFNDVGFKHLQMEFEYEGVLKNSKPPTRKEILAIFYSFFEENLPIFLNRLNNQTKYCKIKEERNK